MLCNWNRATHGSATRDRSEAASTTSKDGLSTFGVLVGRGLFVLSGVASVGI